MRLDSNKIDFLFRRTLRLAEGGWGDTHPNPMVGALVVEDGEVIAEGYHKRVGGPHAEVEALQNLGRSPRSGAALFISLEPCSSHGRTPPCTQAILKSGIKQVYVACIDPNPKHSGDGISRLREAGIKVEVAGPEIRSLAERLNFIFIHNMRTGSPLIALKIAESANGMIAESHGRPSKVTEKEALFDVMNWRRLFPAICVGSGTILSDNPALTVRLKEVTTCPIRLIFDSSLSTLDSSVSIRKLFKDDYFNYTYILTTEKGMKNLASVARAKKIGINLIVMKSDGDELVSLSGLRKVLQDLGLNSLYCEGGAKLGKALLAAGEINYLFRYRSPHEFNGPDALPSPLVKNLALRDPIEKKIGPDILIHGFVQ